MSRLYRSVIRFNWRRFEEDNTQHQKGRQKAESRKVQGRQVRQAQVVR